MTNNTGLPPLSERILYLSDTCMVVNKLAGEAVEGAKQGQQDLPAALSALLAETKGTVPAANATVSAEANAGEFLPQPQAVHRLDVPVSGCVLFARTKPALSFLSAIFSGDTAADDDAPVLIEKRYWAITEIPISGSSLNGSGITGPGGGAVEGGKLVHWLSFDSRLNKSFAHNKPGPGRKKAVLRYRLAGAGRNYLFFEIDLLSGRHHQIRAQFAAAGLHIKGDLKYGAKRSDPNGGIRLHAHSLKFPEPPNNGSTAATGAITLSAEPPLCDNLWLAFREALG